MIWRLLGLERECRKNRHSDGQCGFTQLPSALQIYPSVHTRDKSTRLEKRVYSMGCSTHDTVPLIGNLKEKEGIYRQTFLKNMLSKYNVELYLHLNSSESIVYAEL